MELVSAKYWFGRANEKLFYGNENLEYFMHDFRCFRAISIQVKPETGLQRPLFGAKSAVFGVPDPRNRGPRPPFRGSQRPIPAPSDLEICPWPCGPEICQIWPLIHTFPIYDIFCHIFFKKIFFSKIFFNFSNFS